MMAARGAKGRIEDKAALWLRTLVDVSVRGGQADLVRRTGLAQGYVANFFGGRHGADWRLSTLEAIAHKMGKTPVELLLEIYLLDPDDDPARPQGGKDGARHPRGRRTAKITSRRIIRA